MALHFSRQDSEMTKKLSDQETFHALCVLHKTVFADKEILS